jgi:glutathione S-transferase
VNPSIAPWTPSTAALPVLYTFRRCPYAIRARMALRYACIDVVQREVVLRDKPASMLAISAKGTVPVLQLADGKVLDQSLDIMWWALRQFDPDGWLVTGHPVLAIDWVRLNDETFKPLLDRYKYAERHPELSRAQHLHIALDGYVRALDQRLMASAYLLGSCVSWADVAIFPFVRQFAMVDSIAFDEMRLEGVKKWLEQWLSSELFARVMQKPAEGATQATPA